MLSNGLHFPSLNTKESAYWNFTLLHMSTVWIPTWSSWMNYSLLLIWYWAILTSLASFGEVKLDLGELDTYLLLVCPMFGSYIIPSTLQTSRPRHLMGMLECPILVERIYSCFLMWYWATLTHELALGVQLGPISFFSTTINFQFRKNRVTLYLNIGVSPFHF